MKKIIAVYSSKIPSVKLVCNLMEQAKNNGLIEFVDKPIIDCKATDIAWADVLLAIRPFEVSAFGIVDAAKKANKEIIVFLDDDLLHLPHVYSSRLRKIFTVASYGRNCKYLEEILGKCDVLWSTSRFLLDLYGPLVSKGRVAFSDVSVDVSKMKEPGHSKENVRILFAGSGNHHSELNAYIIPAINKVCEVHNNIELTCIGIREEYINKCECTLRCIPWINDYDDYYEYVLSESFDIGVAPIQQEDFYRCKYYNKYIEYSMLGIVGVYTNDYPYQLVVRDCENGLLAENTIDSWAKRIEDCLEHKVDTLSMVQAAQADCKRRFNNNVQLEMLRNSIPEFFNSVNRSYFNVKFSPNYVRNYARKYANKFVEIYEKIRN